MTPPPGGGKIIIFISKTLRGVRMSAVAFGQNSSHAGNPSGRASGPRGVGNDGVLDVQPVHDRQGRAGPGTKTLKWTSEQETYGITL